MIDQLIIGDKASYDDFLASLASRKIKMPVKKKIKETVPFSNTTYDFSDINGETYWEERELEYIFEIIADNPEHLEELKLKFADWIMNIKDGEIHDPFIPDYHFKGTYEDIEFEDEEGLDKTTVTAKFMAYPYKIANFPRVYEVTLSEGESEKVVLSNESSHRVIALFEAIGVPSLTVTLGDEIMEISSYIQTALFLSKGITSFIVQNLDANNGTLKVSFIEEVF